MYTKKYGELKLVSILRIQPITCSAILLKTPHSQMYEQVTLYELNYKQLTQTKKPNNMNTLDTIIRKPELEEKDYSQIHPSWRCGLGRVS